MKIEQAIHFGRYSVRKTEEHAGEIVRRENNITYNTLVCCLGCVPDEYSWEEHVVAILTACRALGIKTLTAGKMWETIIPSVTVISREKVITDELEQAQYQLVFNDENAIPGEKADIAVKKYVEERRSLYQACGVPFPLGAV